MEFFLLEIYVVKIMTFNNANPHHTNLFSSMSVSVGMIQYSVIVLMNVYGLIFFVKSAYRINWWFYFNCQRSLSCDILRAVFFAFNFALKRRIIRFNLGVAISYDVNNTAQLMCALQKRLHQSRCGPCELLLDGGPDRRWDGVIFRREGAAYCKV